MRHQRNERSERNERGQQGRHQGRSGSNMQGRQDREDESTSRWQDRDEDRGYQGQSSRFDEYDMMSRQGRDMDFGASQGSGWGRGVYQEEPSMIGSSRRSQDYDTSLYGSRDRDMESSYGYSSGSQRGGGQQQGRFENQNIGSQRYGSQGLSNQGPQQGLGGSGMQSYGSQGSYGSQQDIGAERGGRSESTGRFFGRGPKGYKRSDDRIKEEVCEILTRDQEVDASEIDVEVKDGEVTLSGSVPERKMKHQAEDLVENCMGVKDVTNNLRVRKEEGRSDSKEASGESETERSEKRGASGSSSSSAGSASQTSTSKKSGSASSASNPSH